MRAPSAGPLLFRPGCRPPIRYSMRFAYLKFCFETSINNRVELFERFDVQNNYNNIEENSTFKLEGKKQKIVYHNYHIIMRM